MNKPYLDIPGINRYTSIEILTEGHSNNEKYKLTDAEGGHFLLRISHCEYEKEKKNEFENLRRVYNRGIITPKPIEFGKCNNGLCVYMIISWIDGTDTMHTVINSDEESNYITGIKTGKALRKLHDISKVTWCDEWSRRYADKVNCILSEFKKSKLDIDNSELAIKYIEEHMLLIDNRPLVITHGDFHWNNVVLTPENEVGFIDFDKCYVGDGWEEFAGTVWELEYSKSYTKGQIDGYFNNACSNEFFELYTLYVSAYAFEHISLAIKEHRYSDNNKYNAERMLRLFGNYKDEICHWYKEK